MCMGSMPHGAAATATSEVPVRLFQFRPATLAVPANRPITWTNAHDIEHAVTSGEAGKKDGRFEARRAGQGATRVAPGRAPGTYRDFCERHPSMTGDVFIQ
jgi:plastocyanin